MDWPALVEKIGLALVGVLAAYGAITSKLTKDARSKSASAGRRPSKPPASRRGAAGVDERDESLAELDAEIARLWLSVGELREKIDLLRADVAVERHERKSLSPDRPRPR